MAPSDAVVEGVSGAIGGCVATIATYPLMTVTTWQQIRKQNARGTAPLGKGALPRSTVRQLISAVHNEGWASLFPGIGASLLGTTVSQGVYFYLYSLLRAAAVSRRQNSASGRGNIAKDVRFADISVAESLLVASLAGMGNVLLTNPIWVIATRMQAHRKKTSPSSERDSQSYNFLSVANQVYGEYGIGGFWNGCAASLVMVINPTIQYAIYEWLMSARAQVRRRSLGKKTQARASALEVFALSALAKLGATILTYPMMTIKTRMMSARKDDIDIQYKSMAHAVVEIGEKEGMRGYYRGMKAKIVQSVLAASLLFVCKEKITDFTRELLLAANDDGKVQ